MSKLQIEDIHPLSPLQQGMLFHDLYEPERRTYSQQVSCTLTGRLDAAALERAWRLLLDRHAALRAGFLWKRKEEPLQVVYRDVALPWRTLDWCDLAAAGQKSRLEALLAEEHGCGFDFAAAPLMRLVLVRLAPEVHQFVWTFHHLVMDGWSKSLVLQEAFALYEALAAGRTPALPPAIPFGRYIAWLRAQPLDAAEPFWRRYFEGWSGSGEGILARGGDGVEVTGFGRASAMLGAGVTAELRELARGNQLTLNTLLQGAWALLLASWGGGSDVVFGSTVSGRPAALEGVEGMVGLFINTLPTRVRIASDAPLLPWLRRLQAELLEARQYEHTPLVRAHEWSGAEAGRPLFESVVVFENYPMQEGKAAGTGLVVSAPRGTEATNYPLALMATPGAELAVSLLHDSRVSPAMAARLLAHLGELLRGMVREPHATLSRLASLPASERHQAVVEWNDTAAGLPEGVRIHDLFAAQARRDPGALALRAGAEALTYGELDARANRLAHALRAAGVGPESLVGVALDRTAAMVVAVLGVLKAGGAYLPLDPTHPRERLDYMLRASGAAWVVTRAEIAPLLPEHAASPVLVDAAGHVLGEWSGGEPAGGATAEGLAYVIFTSGSTGRPKGVQITHAAVVNFLRSMARRPGLGAGDRLFAVTTLAFDIAGLEIFLPLSVGAAVVLGGEAADGPSLLADLTAAGCTALQATPSAWRLLLDSGWQGTPGLTVLCGGEPLPRDLAGELLGRGRAAWNLYGPTETTIWSAVDEVGAGCVSIGRPIDNTSIHLLDGDFRPVPAGVAGEIHIGGAGLARGYLGRPDLTAERFLPDPFAATPGARVYRTGDLGRRLDDGRLEHLGRNDHQVKIRGYRIELGEVEEALRTHDGVRQAVVAAQPGSLGEPQLVAYVVTGDGAPVAAGELRAHLEGCLPGYMVPALFVSLPALPLTANGKVDRKALPVPEAGRLGLGRDLVAPRTPVERELARLWRELLGAAEVGVEDSFFELGGHSLLAIRLMARVREAFGVEVPLRRLLELPTVAGQAVAVSRARVERAAKPAVTANAAKALPMIAADPARLQEPFPLTEVQQAYWVGRQGSFDLGNVAAHGYGEMETGALDVDRLNRALQRLIARHGMLRAVAHADGTQQILAEVPPYEVELLDWRALTEAEAGERAAEIRRLMSHQVRPADRWPLFEVRVARLAADRHRVYVSRDLLMADAWSARILWRELVALYADPEAPLPELGISFRDYVMAEAVLQASEPYRKAESYWLGRLETLPPAPELPLAHRPASLAAPRFERRVGWLEPTVWLRLKRRAAQAGVTPSGILLSAFAEVLAVWSKRRRFTVNLTTFNRLPLHPQVNDLVGDFTSLTLLEVDHTRPEPLELRARALQERLWEDLEHRYVGGVRVLRELARVRGRDTGTLMPVVFTSLLFETSLAEPAEGAAPPRRSGYGVSQTPQVWLDCQVSEEQGALAFNWDAVSGLFPQGMLDDMFGAYERLLGLLADEPATWREVRHPWVPAGQLALRAEVNATAAPLSGERLHTLFDAQARRQPGRPALIAPERSLTYGELAAAANRLAHRLVAAGAGRGRLVAIVMEKGWEQAVAALAIVKAGAAYLPVDAALPADRLGQLLAQGEVELALTQVWVEARLAWPEGVRRLVVGADDGEDPGAPGVRVEPGDLAYVIFTSGSTGVPKGVMIDHRGAVNTILDVNERFGVTPDDRVLGLSSMSFDLSVYDVFGLAACGGALVLPPASAGRDPGVWLDAIERHGVTLWNSVPALMEMLLEVAGATPGARLDGLRLVMLSGDWIPVHLPDRIRERAPRAELVSLGGATEASIWSILHPIGEVDRDTPSIPYGRPMRNQTFAVLDEALEPCPTWVPGQLYIGGAGLSLGYWRDSERTAAQFPEVGGERRYWTGDVGRYLPDGEIEFLGREDFQVKVQGHRIELGEIETALESHPAVRSAVAAAVGSGANGRRLVAYVVPRGRDAAVVETAERPAGRLTVDSLGRLLASLSQVELAELAFPKYRYASAGNLYPVQAYLDVPEGSVEGLAAGVYYYHPKEHRLHRLRAGLAGKGAGEPPALLLVGELKAIYPVYGELARDFSLLEAGYVGPVLAGAAADEGLGLRHARRGGLAAWRDLLDLEESQLLLQALWIVPGSAGASLPAGAEADDLPERRDPAADWQPAAGHSRGGAAERASGGVAVALALPALLADEVSRLEFRLRQPALRSFGAGAQAVALARPEATPEVLEAYRGRRSHREFLTGPVVRESVLALLEAVAPGDAGAPVLQVFLHCAPGGVAGLAAGTYGYDAGEAGLTPLAPGFEIDPELHAPVNRKPFGQAAFSIFLVAGAAGGHRDRGLLAAGAAAQRLMAAAPGAGFGLCPIGSFDFGSVAHGFGLGVDAVLLHSLVGGAVPRPAVTAADAGGTAAGERLVEELLGYLGQRLPEYMVPARLGLLDALPLSSNGKVDRAALPAFDLAAAVPEARSAAPETDLERQLAALWREVLKVERVGLYDNFFDLGGNSLHMVRFHLRLREALGREIRITELFKHSTIRSLAELLAGEEAAVAPSFAEAADRAGRYREAMRRQRRPAPGRSRDED
jgi:amino acid adenylation domain-containing protein